MRENLKSRFLNLGNYLFTVLRGREMNKNTLKFGNIFSLKLKVSYIV